MHLLILGSGGQLGSELVRVASTLGHDAVPLGHSECDVSDPAAVSKALSSSQFDAVLNCSGYTRVDAAESDVDAAYRVNALGPQLLAAECHRLGILLTHVSTDFVFDGAAGDPIEESAPTRPLSVYGASKLAGEAAVRSLAPKHQVVRTSWLYGMSGPNFVLTMLRLARERGRLRVVGDQFGTPTWTGHLAPALLRLVESGIPGTFHLSNGGATTWHGFAGHVVERAGLDVEVESISTAEYPTPARRPAYSVLDNRNWRLLGEEPLPGWQDGVNTYLDAVLADGADGHVAQPRQ